MDETGKNRDTGKINLNLDQKWENAPRIPERISK